MSVLRQIRWVRSPRAACRAAARIALAGAAALLTAGPLPARDDPAAVLRVGTSGDYPPFSQSSGRDGGDLRGLDVALARAYAADRGVPIEFVRFRWPGLLRDLEAARFDVAMSGVTVRPERSAAGRFSLPVVESGAVVLALDPDRFASLTAVNRAGVRVGVNAGGHLEDVAGRHFPAATLVAIPDNASVKGALVGEFVDAVVSDSIEAAVWESDTPGLARLGPFTRDRKAFLLRADAAALAADLDAWLVERERDGTLPRLRREYLGRAADGSQPALPLAALVAALDERLSLMPLVGAAKREEGLPLEVPERETAVLDAASAAVLAEAQRGELAPPSFSSTRGFFRALMEAAKEVQRKATREEPAEAGAPIPSLEEVLRPALDRIDERIVRLILALPRDLERDAVRAQVADGIRAAHVSDASKRAIADALDDLYRDARE